MLPIINRWQEFKLVKKTDGIDGVIRVCIMSENGKVNLNQIFDFKTKKFKGQGQVARDYAKSFKIIAERLKSFVEIDLYQPNLSFLTKRGYPLNDIN